MNLQERALVVILANEFKNSYLLAGLPVPEADYMQAIITSCISMFGDRLCIRSIHSAFIAANKIIRSKIVEGHNPRAVSPMDIQNALESCEITNDLFKNKKYRNFPKPCEKELLAIKDVRALIYEQNKELASWIYEGTKNKKGLTYSDVYGSLSTKLLK